MKEEFLIKDEEETRPDIGYNPWERPINFYLQYGVINLDKPRGPTSHVVTSWVKKITGADKAGHAGTLDPGVSGVLPVGINRATPALRYVLHSPKEYVGIMRLHGDVPIDEIREVFSIFKGRIYQRPPKKSAVRRKLRTREIYELELLDFEGRNVLFRLKCESGFYVRKLVHDMGLILGVEAHLAELRRIRTGPFGEDETLTTLHDLDLAFTLWRKRDDPSLIRKVVLPIEVIFRDFPKIVVRDSAVSALAHGAQLAVPGVLRLTKNVKKGEIVAIFTQKGEIIAVGRAQMDYKDILELEKGIAAILERVFIPRDLYPKMWRRRR
ncbi:RNA-guided pseudouridylation complex pseudouridine synthase subunit Cbf5 [Candidatus Geothermarchaeota archaeon]|nr:MAG: RNA-guided pseudouridylation complex pseudouridine synthase subunit Cbf5 [Candidatus Geothermarchaeota archaeon]